MVFDEFADSVNEVLGDENIEDAQPKVVRKGKNSPKFDIKSEGNGKIVELNIDAWDESNRKNVISQLEPLFNNQEGIFRPESNRYEEISESSITDERINATIDYFECYLSDDQTTLLRRCLSIRQDWERDNIHISKNEMDDLKHQLSQDFRYAHKVSNLVSSGYYDAEGYFREIFESLDGSMLDGGEYMNIYFEVLDKEPFFIFVGESDRPRQVSKQIKNKLSKYNTYPINVRFIDALAIGGRAREVLEKAVLKVQRDVRCATILIEVERASTKYRFYPETIDGLSI